MNYDAQQYTFSHGLATAPQLHLQQLQQHQLHHQQHQLHHQQQQIFQQQYSQAVPTSNVYQFQFTGGGNPTNHIFQQKDAHQMGILGGIQSRLGQHSLVPQPLIKQGVQVGIDVVSGFDGMMYSQPKGNLKIITNSDGRILQQSEDTVRMQQALVGVDIMRNSNFMDQSLNAQQNQHQSIRVAGHNSMFAYGKQNFTGWLQPKQVNMPGTAQCANGYQSSLPSFSNAWSQFQHQKQVDVLHQQHLNQYQQPQQFQNQLHQQPQPSHQLPQQPQPSHQLQQQHQMHTQLQFTAPSFQTTPSIQRIKMHPQQKPQQICVPVSMQTISHVPQEFNCFSPNQTFSNCIDAERPGADRKVPSVGQSILISSQSASSCTQPLSSCIERHPTTAVTYTISGPPKVTVTLDSLTHGETFPPNQLPSRSEASFNTAHLVKGKIVKPSNSITSSLLAENFHSQSQREWQTSHNQRSSCLPKSLVHSSSTGSSIERSSSEGSNFSSPPYIFTPPCSSDSIFSQFSKVTTEGSSSGRTSTRSSSSSSMSLSSSPPVTFCLSSQPLSQYATTTVPTVTAASSIASSTCTMSAATVVSSCSSMAINTTSVMTTTPSPKENTSIASVCSSKLAINTKSSAAGNLQQPCSPTHRSLSPLPDTVIDKKVKVPYSWQRVFENGVIVYLSPSGAVLQSLDQICHYLLSDSTCKCGLECPIQPENFFNFDPDVGSQPWSACSGVENLGNLCNHRREVLALASFHSSQSEAAVIPTDHDMWLGRKRERKKSVGAGEGLIVAPLKKLKTSITNAVNKHALTIGSGTPRTPPAVDKSLVSDADVLFQNPNHQASISPASSRETPGSCSSHCGFPSPPCSPGGSLVSGRCDSMTDVDKDNNLVPGSVPMQKIGDQDRIEQEDLYHLQQPQGNCTTHVFRQGNGRDVSMNLHSQYPLVAGAHSNQQSIQYPQGKLQHHHQSTNPGLSFPQSHVYSNMPHVGHQQQHIGHQQQNIGHQQPQGSHPQAWQGGYPETPSSIPRSHHHPPRPYPPSANFQHSSFNPPQPNTTPYHQQTLEKQAQMDCSKAKPKRPKRKIDKQNNSIADRCSPCSKILSKPAVKLPTTASFFGNPIVFVEQQAAIINNSIASCQITFSSPSPPRCESTKPIVTCPPLTDTAFENIAAKSNKDSDPVKCDSIRVLTKNEIVNKEYDEDQKAGTDLDSNKSFSDTTENNDSAYLSQNGSDQERSDLLDGLDSCLETKLSSSDFYSYNSLSDRERKQNIGVNHCGKKSSGLNCNATNTVTPKKSLKTTTKAQQEYSVVSSKICNTGTNCQESKKITKSKPRQKTVARAQDGNLLKKNLSGDLSQLLASNNWNIPALQQVLANYNGGDPGQLNAAIQQVQSQPGVDFPASNLLSAAARAQLNLKQKDQVVPSVSNGKNAVPQVTKIEVLPTVVVGSCAQSDVKTGIVSTAVCGTMASSVVAQHTHPSFQQMAGASLIGNMMQFQQLPAGGFAMNMLLPTNGQGHVYTTEALHSGTFSAESDLKNGQGTINPLMAQGILATMSQTGDINSQIKLSVASVIPSSLGPHVAQCSADSSTMLLNGFGPGMIMNAPMPPVSVSVVTNVTKSLAQVVPTIGINQTIFGAQQLLSSHQNNAQIISTGSAAPGTHMISTSPQGAQLINTAPQGAQFVNPTAQRAQLLNSTPQAAQIMNALSVQGLNNQLLITNPIQQVSPSNSISQLSPAMAAQILAQSHTQLPQMSPSYLQNRLQKQAQNSVITNQNIFASVSLPPLTVTSAGADVIAGSMTHSGGNIHKNSRICDGLDKVALATSISQVKDPNASIASSSVYATTSQPVFVIPQPNSNSMMQMIGSAQQLTATSGLSADLNLQPGSLSQMFGQSPAVDQSLIQSLLAGGFSPLTIQQMMNAVSLNGVQQQQLQMLQLQQLMLQQFQNQSQNMQGISLPLTQSSNPNHATSTIVSAVMPQASLQLNSLMDMSTLHPCLSPVAQGYQNQLSPATAPLQHISSALAVHQATHVNSCGAVSVVQGRGVQNLMQIPAKHLQAGHSLQPQQLSSDQVIHTNQNPAVNPSGTPPQEPPKVIVAEQAQQLVPSSPKSAASIKPPLQQSKSKPKPKFKKCENKKTPGSETQRKEEDIAATVQQILAQAAQQQKEFILSTKAQTTPPSKNKNKKSQNRSKANQAAKEHDLGRLASISDDGAIPKSECTSLKNEIISLTDSVVVEPSHFSSIVTQSSHSDVQQPVAISPHNQMTLPFQQETVSDGRHRANGLDPAITSFVEQTLNETTNLKSSVKKPPVSLKNHLSSLIFKDGSNKP